MATRSSSTAPVVVDDAFKVFVARIPSHFTEDSIKRLLETSIGSDSVVQVNLKGQDDENVDDTIDEGKTKKTKKQKLTEADAPSSKTTAVAAAAHKGYAFVQFSSTKQASAAVQLAKVRGGAKETSTKQYTIYISDVGGGDDTTPNVCFLWQQFKCPYGGENQHCKFAHTGPGGCALKKNSADGNIDKRKRKQCWMLKKGKCTLGDDCPYSHDFDVSSIIINNNKKEAPVERPTSEKDCINWRTKGKCRKGDNCPYRHDPALLDRVLKKKKRKQDDVSADERKKQQPLSVRVFGMNYDTKEADVRELFESCGKINEICFPCFSDSGRSKGFCEVHFASPKAVDLAVQLHETELHGRWLSVQAGKMYLNQWEAHIDTSATTKHKY